MGCDDRDVLTFDGVAATPNPSGANIGLPMKYARHSPSAM
jgi:hypothetical protein